MFKFSLVSMTISSSFLFALLSFCQIGPDWEVPQGLVRKMIITGDLGIIFFALGIVFFIFSIRRFLQLDKKRKAIYVIWDILIVCAIVLIVINGTPDDVYRIYNNMISNIAVYGFLPGFVISTTAFIYLAFGKKVMIKESGLDSAVLPEDEQNFT